jgi:hypothetical protein
MSSEEIEILREIGRGEHLMEPPISALLFALLLFLGITKF